MAAATRTVARLDAQSVALFVCDIQQRFAKAIHAFQNVVDTSAKMLRAAEQLGLPVFTTEQNPKGARAQSLFPLFSPSLTPVSSSRTALGSTVSPLRELIASLPASSSSAVHPKTRFSMVLPGITDEWIQKHGTKSVVIMGIESHVCVLQTTLDLLERGIDVHVLADGVSAAAAGGNWPLSFTPLIPNPIPNPFSFPLNRSPPATRPRSLTQSR